MPKESLIELLLRSDSGGDSNATKDDGNAADGAAEAGDASPPKKKQKRQENRPFDFSRHASRHIALKVSYIGTDYLGFAHVQEAPTATVEGQLLHAMMKTCLIADRDSCGISCGGRTDKGVSALGQVVALRVRSNLTEGEGILPAVAATAAATTTTTTEASATPGEEAKGRSKQPREELDYVHMLNRVLPADIRVLGWHPTDADFSARFSANGRTYKYFFARGQLDVERMRAAAKLLLGEHDLRNFCKIDPSVTNFVRRINSFDVDPVMGVGGGVDPANPQALWAFTVSGTAFLYHQVRCMVAILFLVGEGKEEPSIVTDLLDIVRMPRRPNYDMASDAPLLLHSIGYEDIPTWRTSTRNHTAISELWGEQQRELMHRAAMYHTMRESLELPADDAMAQMLRASLGTAPAGGVPKKSGPHVPLAKRPTHESVEVRTKGKAK